jgi:hypothetical protein
LKTGVHIEKNVLLGKEQAIDIVAETIEIILLETSATASLRITDTDTWPYI